MAPRSSSKSRRQRAAPPSEPAGSMPALAPSTAPPAAPIEWRKWALLFLALLVVTLFVYRPAWHGAPIWDDDAHLTQPDLQSVEGLERIWTDLRATQQYYPLVHSSFWLMHRIWGDNTTGYHLVNIVLHTISALLLAVLIRRLSVPGAWFAAFLFALHPMQVESVAWMTELKNVLSTPLYLGAALAYLRFDQSRRRRDWLMAAFLFVLALLSKTVTATLPVSLLVLAWWRRGEIQWRHDVRPILPLFVLAIGAGALTAWAEHTLIGASGSAFSLTLVERVLLAGRAVWFYLVKYLWPLDLVFIYPRWQISQAVWWQYLFPVALAALMLALWRVRGRTRAPLAALLLFGAALGPALGFVNVYPFRYSYVADHFQYTASLVAAASVAAALTTLATARVHAPAMRAGLAALVLAPLAGLSWFHSHQYADAKTLYTTIIARNPKAFMAFHNLGILKLDSGSPTNLQDALKYVEESIRLEPNNAEGLNTRGFIRMMQGDFVGARPDLEESIRLNPAFSSPHNNLGVLEYKQGHLDTAMALYREAMRLNPKDPEPQRNLGIALLDVGRVAEADTYIRRAYELNPSNPDVVFNLATLTLREDRLDEAVVLFKQAIALRHDFPAARNNLGITLERLHRLPEAEAQYREVLKLDPQSGIAHDNLGYVLLQQQRFAEAVPYLAEAVRLRPDAAPSAASLAEALQGAGRIDESIAAFRRALQMPANAASPDLHNSFGVALAERGRMAEAIAEFREALRIDPGHRDARNNLARALGK